MILINSADKKFVKLKISDKKLIMCRKKNRVFGSTYIHSGNGEVIFVKRNKNLISVL